MRHRSMFALSGLIGLAILILAAAQKSPAEQDLSPFEPMTIVQAEPVLDHDERRLVLFDGRNWDAWRTREGEPCAWIVKDDESIEVKAGAGDAVSREEFGDFQLHIEFLCPPLEGKRGQARSNSGVYVHGRYEIQILDSHTMEPANNLCGGIYQIAAPLANASRPAGKWQTYEIMFRAPRFDHEGKVTEKPRITVMHNDLVIHNNFELPSTTPGGIDRQMVARGPILLQDHGDPVRFRNIWIRRLD